MSLFPMTYNQALAMLRGMCHLVGDVPYSDTTLIAILRAALGEVFSRVPLVHERYWMVNDDEIDVDHGMKNQFTKPEDLVRVVTMEGVLDTSDTVYRGFRETSAIEVEDEYEREIDSTNTNDLERQMLFADKGSILITSIDLDTITISYVADPSVTDKSATGSSTISCPAHLIMPVIQLAGAQVEMHTNAERAQFMETRAGRILKEYQEGIMVVENHATRRKQSYTKAVQTGQVRIKDY